MLAVWDKLAFYFAAGGYVMPPLALVCLLIWFGIGYRWSVLRRPDDRNVRRLLQKCLAGDQISSAGLIERAVVKGVAAIKHAPKDVRRCLDDVFYDDEQALRSLARFVKSLVVVAPILGLLGTVDGMIETFQALGNMTLFSQSTSIAGGISQALFTTQLGLAVAVPAMVVNGMLERRARVRLTELTQLKDMLSAEAYANKSEIRV